MAKQFKDFSFCGKKFSGLSTKYISVDFDNNSDINLAMERDMTVGETNRYKTEANYFYDSWTGVLEFDLHIMKDHCTYNSQESLEITKAEIREITRWLTSTHFPEWIRFEYDDDNEVKRYCGWFSNIETFTAYGTVYGLKLHFKCTTPFGYTDEKSYSVTSSKSYKSLLVTNDSDELNCYCYPQLTISPKNTNEIFICNQSDMKVLKQGTLSSSNSYFDALLDAVEDYAKSNGYTVEYTGTGAQNIVALCDSTAVQFYLVDAYGDDVKCTAYYKNDSAKQYQIIQGGFMYLSLNANLDVTIDTRKMLITDSIDRMVTYDKLGIKDVDQMYWLRFINGNNTLLLYGDYDLTIKFSESRKVGE